ncbi:helix-turn-helix domain-containing protein [Brucella pituitosa]|uniref:Helix-turn-helix domain-containing protein n=2 Tax=Brucella pituitosa TaxID=571256 RepID=A0A643F568_9HYPH|nr:helix-turn-helix domain-containing protein [Brucella pituitosa]KAB0572614.1 helix-turn-helix domain-containing protein [Brucella pituitosa]
MSDDFTRSRMVWLDQIYDDQALTTVSRDAAFRISRYFNRRGFASSGNLNAWPSYETLAKEAGCSPKTIQRAVTLLRERGHIVTNGNGGRSKALTYFAVIKVGTTTDEMGADIQSIAPDKGGQNCPRLVEKVDTAVPKGGHLNAEKVDKNVLQTSLNKSLIKSLSAARAHDAADEPFKAAWSIAIFDKLAKGPGALPRPGTALLRNLIEIEKRPALVLDHQAKHGWPEINSMFEQPKALEHETLAPSIRKMAFEMEAVTSGSARWKDWQCEFEARGWPFPRDAKTMSFPRGGVKALPAFMNALLARQAGGGNVVLMAARAVGA